MNELTIVESYPRYYFYHLARGKVSNGAKSLCGYEEGTKTTLERNIPLSAWGYVGHLNEKYCKRCECISGINISNN